MQNTRIGFVVFIVLILGIPLTGFGQATPSGIQPPADRVIRPPDVYALTLLLHKKLDVLALEMGEPRDTRPEIRVVNVQPREVFFQALTLFQKASRLCFEFTRQGHSMPQPPRGDILPGHVWNVVREALGRIECVEQAIQMTHRQDLPPPDETKTPTDVFRAIIQANRQLNILLEGEFSPTDVFGQVTLATRYSADLLAMLARFDEQQAVTTPELPPYEGGKRPADVYRRLAACVELIERIAQASGLHVLEFAPDDMATVTPSDVYDIASLVVSELYYFSTLLDQRPPERPVRNQRMLPSHVYQQVGFLQAQLAEIQRLVQRYPNWHTLNQ